MCKVTELTENVTLSRITENVKVNRRYYHLIVRVLQSKDKLTISSSLASQRILKPTIDIRSRTLGHKLAYLSRV